MKSLRSWMKRILTAVGVILLLVLVIDFNSRMVHLLELRGELEAEQARLDELVQEEAVLEQAIGFAESDEAIDEWAREQNRMGQEGDIVVVPISDGTILEVEQTEVAEPQDYISNWEAWILWLTYRE
jgi:cell division protein FtsB